MSNYAAYAAAFATVQNPSVGTNKPKTPIEISPSKIAQPTVSTQVKTPIETSPSKAAQPTASTQVKTTTDTSSSKINQTTVTTQVKTTTEASPSKINQPGQSSPQKETSNYYNPFSPSSVSNSSYGTSTYPSSSQNGGLAGVNYGGYSSPLANYGLSDYSSYGNYGLSTNSYGTSTQQNGKPQTNTSTTTSTTANNKTPSLSTNTTGTGSTTSYDFYSSYGTSSQQNGKPQTNTSTTTSTTTNNTTPSLSTNMTGTGNTTSYDYYSSYSGYSYPSSTIGAGTNISTQKDVKPTVDTSIKPSTSTTTSTTANITNPGLSSNTTGAGSTTNNYSIYSSYGGYSYPSSIGGTGLNITTQNEVKPTPQPEVKPTVQPSTSFGLNYDYSTKPSVQPSVQPYVPSYNLPTANPTGLVVGELNDLSTIGRQMFSDAFAKSSIKSAYQSLLSQLKNTGQKYKDLEFPSELKSLTGGLSEYELASSGNPLNWRSIIWLRPEEIYGKGKYQIFEGDIEPNDIKQGSLGDCYFLSTLASIAEFPGRIRKLFETEEINEHGCYGVKVCDMGIWQTIILDDLIPCSSKTRTPIFSRGVHGELWVQLLEKAWSKIYGGYAKIEAGLTRECLHDLTGAPTKYFLTGDPKNNETIWHAIVHGEKKNFIMTCGSGDFFEGADLMGSMGLVGSHAYSLLAAIQTKDRYGRELKLVQIRNPWGQGEWTGDWSDESPLWTPELKQELKWEDLDDGIFFMTYADMLKYFTDIQICKIHDDYKYKSVKSSCDHLHACFFKITVRTPGQYYFTVNQESKRKHDERENYRYSYVSLVFGKKVGDDYEYVEGIQKADKEVWTDGKLSAGEYIIYAKVAWNEKRTRDFVLSAYGKGEVEIQQVPKAYCPGFVEKVYLSKGRQAKKYDDYKHCGIDKCYRAVELTDDGFGYIYYRNESNKTLEEELYFKFFDGLKLKKPYTGNSYKITVPSGQEKIVITKVLPNATKIRQAFTERARFI